MQDVPLYSNMIRDLAKKIAFTSSPEQRMSIYMKSVRRYGGKFHDALELELKNWDKVLTRKEQQRQDRLKLKICLNKA